MEIKLDIPFLILLDEDDWEKVKDMSIGLSMDRKCQIYYAVCYDKSQNKRKFLHTIIMNPPEGMIVDHINNNPLDCRKENLRVCTIRENNFNSSKRKNCSSIYKGVSFHKKTERWFVSIRKDGVKFNLGYYNNEKDAGLIYDQKAKELFGEYANLNFPDHVGEYPVQDVKKQSEYIFFNKRKQKYYVLIRKNKQRIQKGYFKSYDEAIIVRNELLKDLR